MKDMICHDRSGHALQFDNLHGHYIPDDNDPEAPMGGTPVAGSGLGYGSEAYIPSDTTSETQQPYMADGGNLIATPVLQPQAPVVQPMQPVSPQVRSHNGYNIDKAVNYARQWAMKRNSRYYDFEKIGGDCTNFISQSIYAGCQIMNSKKDTGWYYNNVNDRAASWTSAEFLYKFLVGNTGRGPHGHVIDMSQVRPGDVIQISFDGQRFAHSMLVTKVDPTGVYICTHSYDSHDREMSTYSYHSHRVIRIDGVRR